MADDLDAFFDEVEDAVEQAKEEETKVDTQKAEDEEVKPPPTKKFKRPLGVVVAAASGSRVDTSKLIVEEPASVDIRDRNNGYHSRTGPPGFMLPPGPPMPRPPPPIDANPPAVAAPQYLPQNSDIPDEKRPVHKRAAAGKTWEDKSLADWPENDYRLFVGNLSKDVTDPQLFDHFSKYSSLQMVKVVRNPARVSKGYGFVSLLDPMDCAKAIREMDQSWLNSRPIKVKRSDWKERELKHVQKMNKKRQKASRRY